jgi:hypothetical protein
MTGASPKIRERGAKKVVNQPSPNILFKPQDELVP